MHIDACGKLAREKGAVAFGVEYPQGSSTPGHGQCLVIPESAVYSAMSKGDDLECEKELEPNSGHRLGSGRRLAVYWLVANLDGQLHLNATVSPPTSCPIACYACKGARGDFAVGGG